jgi:hypothetical protein
VSAQYVESAVPVDDAGEGNEAALAPRAVEVRRNAAVAAVIGASASAVAIAYLWRAVGSGAPLDWLLCALLGLIGAVHLRGLLESRVPLLVADEMGVRIRFGGQWRGLPWEAIDRVVVQPRRGRLRDGRLVVHLHHLARAIEGLEGRALRHARLNQRVYGAPLAVPLGLTTRVSGHGEDDLGDHVAALSQGRAEVVTLLDTPGQVVRRQDQSVTADRERPVIEAEAVPEADRRPRWLRRRQDAADPAAEKAGGSGPPEAGGDDDRGAGPDAGRDSGPNSGSHIGAGSVLDAAEPSPGRRRVVPFRVVDAVTPVTSDRVRPIARLAEPVDPLVIGEFEPHPAYDPVIGPELAAARTRVGLTVDALAERTRIRPHVIESIEVDDFSPCGGDFYARGHIRTLARVLGKDPVPMLTQFEARYATAPVSAKRVFEAELATGMKGTVRGGGLGGPNWTLLIGAVLLLVLVWSGVRLFAGEGEEMLETPPPVLNGSAGLGTVFGEPRVADEAPAVPTTITAVNGGAHVEVRDGAGELVFEGDLVIGEAKQVEADPPVTVSSDSGGAVSVAVGGEDQGLLGPPDQPATRVFQRPDD